MDEQDKKQESYYDILSFLEYQSKIGIISESRLKDFKEILRDNKYVSTYIRALKKQFDEQKIKTYSDYQDKDAKHDQTHQFEDLIPWIIRKHFSYKGQDLNDPVLVIRDILHEALEREGKLCDFRDSIHASKKFGVCEYENHDELYCDTNDVKYNEDEEPIIPRIIEELSPIMYTDEETSKFDDSSPEYICTMCMNDLQENEDCAEVSCDLE